MGLESEKPLDEYRFVSYLSPVARGVFVEEGHRCSQSVPCLTQERSDARITWRTRNGAFSRQREGKE